MSILALILAVVFAFLAPGTALQTPLTGDSCALNPQRLSVCQPDLLPIAAEVQIVVSGTIVPGRIDGYYYEPTGCPGTLRTVPGQRCEGDTLVYFVATEQAIFTVPVTTFPVARAR